MGPQSSVVARTLVALGGGLFFTLALDHQPISDQASAQPARTSLPQSERARHLDEALKSWQANDFPKAVAATERLIALDRDNPGEDSENLLESLEQLAEIHLSNGNFAAARPPQQELISLSRQVYGAGHSRVTDALLDVALLDRLLQLNPTQLMRLASAGELDKEAREFFEQKNTGGEGGLLAIRRQSWRQGQLSGSITRSQRPLGRVSSPVRCDSRRVGAALPRFIRSKRKIGRLRGRPGRQTGGTPVHRGFVRARALAHD
jgi:hypothetical protein